MIQNDPTKNLLFLLYELLYELLYDFFVYYFKKLLYVNLVHNFIKILILEFMVYFK